MDQIEYNNTLQYNIYNGDELTNFMNCALKEMVKTCGKLSLKILGDRILSNNNYYSRKSMIKKYEDLCDIF